MMKQRHELYVDNCCPGQCGVHPLAMTRIKFERNPETGDKILICPTCGRKSKDFRYDKIESDIDDIVNDIWSGLWMCPLSQIPCNTGCPHYVKPHIIETETEKVIDLRFCSLNIDSLLMTGSYLIKNIDQQNK